MNKFKWLQVGLVLLQFTVLFGLIFIGAERWSILIVLGITVLTLISAAITFALPD